MNEFAILSNRKRAIIALVHSVVFLLVAVAGAASAPLLPFWVRIHTAFGAAVAMFAIYAIVTTILLILTFVSRCSMERLYFGFCSMSAGVGLLRALLGDPPLHAAQIVRVLMLSFAVFIGFMIFREHSESELAE